METKRDEFNEALRLQIYPFSALAGDSPLMIYLVSTFLINTQASTYCLGEIRIQHEEGKEHVSVQCRNDPREDSNSERIKHAYEWKGGENVQH